MTTGYDRLFECADRVRKERHPEAEKENGFVGFVMIAFDGESCVACADRTELCHALQRDAIAEHGDDVMACMLALALTENMNARINKIDRDFGDGAVLAVFRTGPTVQASFAVHVPGATEVEFLE